MRNLVRFLITIVILYCFISSCGQKVKETFFIPSGFQGRINVIFNQPDATPVPIKGGRRIYQIPADGVLITSSKLEIGSIDQEYYYLDKDGKRIEIAVLNLNSNVLPEKPAVVYYGVTGVYGNSTDTNPLNYLESIIASKSSSDSIYSQPSRKAFDEIIKRKVGRRF